MPQSAIFGLVLATAHCTVNIVMLRFNLYLISAAV
jgi:hypothetical protein